MRAACRIGCTNAVDLVAAGLDNMAWCVNGALDHQPHGYNNAITRPACVVYDPILFQEAATNASTSSVEVGFDRAG